MYVMNDDRRPCPICGGPAGKRSFPYATRFNNVIFGYFACRKCGTVFVDPVPDAQTFSAMYTKSNYHDTHYSEVDVKHYAISAKLLARFLPNGAFVLDYGCGVGQFLSALKAEGFLPTGVEFDDDAAQFAGHYADCTTLSVEMFRKAPKQAVYDVIHLGDVLEHLPDPAFTLRELLTRAKPGGFLFVEGPLEINASPVSWAARTFGAAKRCVRPNAIGASAPTHLLRVNARRQKDFFTRVEPRLTLLHWETYETGWPYAGGGPMKRTIATLAVVLGGRTIFGETLGNRFRAIFRLPEANTP